MTRILALILALSFTTAAHAAPIDNSDGFWSEWSDATFARAAREKKFVIMSLQSWWCRWCHVMNQETWSNAEVRGILKDKFIPVYVDQDSRPDISQRYERWGWPAGVVGQARGQARQYRRRLSGFPRRTRGVRLHRDVLLLSGDGSRRDPGAARRPQARAQALNDCFQKTPSRVHKPATRGPNCRLIAGRF
jgi:hypothetical protein